MGDEEDQLDNQELNELSNTLKAHRIELVEHKLELVDIREENKLISDMLYQLLDRIETDFEGCRSSADYHAALYGLVSLGTANWFSSKKENNLKLLQQSALAKLTPEELDALKQLGLP